MSKITQIGLPPSGTTGQVLKKKTGTNYDVEWADSGTVTQPSRFNGYAYAVWSGTGLVFDVVWPSYYIDNVLYSAGSGQVTLDSADPTNPRLDVIAVDSTGVIKITGTADTNPVKPTVNVMTQLEITTVLVNATATTPAITDTTVYKENVEWTGATNNGTVTFNNTVTPFEGTYCVNSGSFNNTHYIRFTGASSYNVGDFGVLKFYLRLSASFASTTYINVRLFNTATAISSTVSITNGSYNFNRTATGYQLIIIPISAFTFTASVFNRVEFTFVGSNTSGFKMDNIILQSGSGTSPTGVLTGAGDQNYVTKWTGVTSLGNSLLYDNASGVGIGTITPATTSLLDLTSTTKGLLIPRMTGTQRDAIVSPATGLQVYNTTTNKINYYNGTAWTESGGGGGTPGGSNTQVQFNDSGAFGGDAGLTYNKTTDVLTSGGAILSGETASTIASFDGSKQIKSLATTTYPSLTELSYVKGLTSSAQTQINSKETNYRYEIVTVLDQDIWLNNSSITKVVKSAGINTVEYKINAGSYTALTFTSGVWTGTISVTANDVLSWRITYNAGYTTGSFNVVHNRV